MSGVQTRLQKDAAAARAAADAATAAAGAPPPPPGAAQGSSTDQMLAFLVAQMAHQQRFAAAQAFGHVEICTAEKRSAAVFDRVPIRDDKAP